MAASPTPIPDPAADAPAAAAPRIARPVLATLIALGAAVLVAITVIIVLVVPKGGPNLADAPVAGTASPTARPTASPTPKPTKTPDAATPTPKPADPAPAPLDNAPAPAEPGPVQPPPLPAPPPPVIPAPAITSMDAYYSGACTTSTKITLAWTSTDGSSADINVRSGGGTPIFNQLWTGYGANDSNVFLLDCTRPVWFFTLTIYNSSGSKKGLLTFANGSNQGWSSN